MLENYRVGVQNHVSLASVPLFLDILFPTPKLLKTSSNNLENVNLFNGIHMLINWVNCFITFFYKQFFSYRYL